MLATAIAASFNGLAFERAADPDALPDEVFAEFVTAVLGCAIARPGRDVSRSRSGFAGRAVRALYEAINDRDFEAGFALLDETSSGSSPSRRCSAVATAASTRSGGDRGPAGGLR